MTERELLLEAVRDVNVAISELQSALPNLIDAVNDVVKLYNEGL